MINGEITDDPGHGGDEQESKEELVEQFHDNTGLLFQEKTREARKKPLKTFFNGI